MNAEPERLRIHSRLRRNVRSELRQRHEQLQIENERLIRETRELLEESHALMSKISKLALNDTEGMRDDRSSQDH